MATRIRNKCCVPFLNREGIFEKNIIPEIYNQKDLRCEDLAVAERLFAHQTLASARRFAYFRPFNNLIPLDQLDFALSSGFNQTNEIWPLKKHIYKQPESLGIDTWRRLRNTRDITPDREQLQTCKKSKKIPFKYNYCHKVLIGGVGEKTHPSSVKLMNSSHHSPQTNAGYSRQDSDGNPYQY